MRLKLRAWCLVGALILQTVVAVPLLKRSDEDGIPPSKSSVDRETKDETLLPAASDRDEKVSLSEEEVFGGGDGGSARGLREKRFLKLKSLGIGAAAGAAAKSVGLLGVKAAGKALASVAVKLAKAAVTIGIAKLILTLIFGKINQVIDVKTRLLNHQGLLGVSNLSNGSQGGTGETASDDAGSTDQDEDLPEIDPDKVALQVPDQLITSGFNVVNRAAPVVGSVIQNTAERLARIVEVMKPVFRSSILGGLNGGNSGGLKREAPSFEEKSFEEEAETPIKNSFIALGGA